MTKNFEDLLTIFSYVLTPNNEIDMSNFSFDEIYKIAKAQQVHTIIFPAIKSLKGNNKISIDEKLYESWERLFFKNIIFSLQRNQYVSDLVKKLEEKKIKNCILKGISLSELYPVPESRVSSDVDLLIPDKAHVKIVLDMLAKDGFHIGEILESSHQIECHHPSLGLIEIHTDICDEIAKNVWFENSIEFSDEFFKKKDENTGEYYALSITDGAVYVTFHFLKHFLSHGCGIRQLLDMLLYLKVHEKAIDWRKYNFVFSNLNYLRFIDRCKDIGNRYFGMNFVVLDPNEKLCLSVLTDMENGGVFGYNEEYRKSFTYHYTRMRSTTFSHSQSRVKKFIERCWYFVKSRRYNIILIAKDFFYKRKKENILSTEINERLDLFKSLGFFEK